MIFECKQSGAIVLLALRDAAGDTMARRRERERRRQLYQRPLTIRKRERPEFEARTRSAAGLLYTTRRH